MVKAQNNYCIISQSLSLSCWMPLPATDEMNKKGVSPNPAATS